MGPLKRGPKAKKCPKEIVGKRFSCFMISVKPIQVSKEEPGHLYGRATRWRIKLAMLIYKFPLFLHRNRTERIIGFNSLEISVSHLDDLTYVGWYLL